MNQDKQQTSTNSISVGIYLTFIEVMKHTLAKITHRKRDFSLRAFRKAIPLKTKIYFKLNGGHTFMLNQKFYGTY